MQSAVYNLAGKEVGKITLSDSIFALQPNNDLVHQAYVTLQGNRRQVLAHTKNRGERKGSGIKPWRQKGTGRARVGSVRTPVWRKGGVVFGPTSERNFKKKINRKMNSKALAIVLSGKVRDKELLIVDKLEVKEMKTKKMAEALKNFNLKGTTLLGFSEAEKGTMRLSRNLPRVENILTRKLNVLDILNKKNLILSQESIKWLEDKFANKLKSNGGKEK